ncbi:aldehyde dehydrogenase family protein [Mycolicibacterium hodleri]|uniref:Aldehyde dehydrogenase family protein n=1 Tax=Mycolicibacterium hodleri TaxID=49897 RepID=A0A502E435_9MYCO|nr:aldehyde dehydrogenase family protein [Mycolicibacterium hodleri]TPG32393.1 aldehyde dehydrogenase family protein [Mycolicibacterium hodleri]
MSADVDSVAGPAGATTDVIAIRCPADGRLIGEVPNQTVEEVVAAAESLRAAQPKWEAIGPAGRAVWLAKWRDWILDNRNRLLELVQAEGGKSWGDASIEALAAVESLNYYLSTSPQYLRDEHPKASGVANVAKRLSVRHRPYPLVGLITPWNYPLAMPMLDCPAALMAGCAVLSKPSEVTPLAWQEAVRGWRAIGAPDVLGVVTGLGATGAAVVDAVDMVQFTGSTKTGRLIGARAAERLVPCSLELGGKDAMIVLADADLERAANGAVWGGFFNAGQSCTAVERVYVVAEVYDAFVERVTTKVAALREGMDSPGTYRTDIGSVATGAQLDIVERHVREAVEAGARVVTGGRRASDAGFVYEATLLVDVDNAMSCMREETFGPTLPVMRVADADEAVRLANDSNYGLSASVWTKDKEMGKRIANRLNVGAVNINSCMMNVFQFPVPQAGWSESGIGSRGGGAHGVLKYTRPQSVVSDVYEPRSEIFWYPHTSRLGKLQEFAVGLLGARDWRRRLGLKKH